MSDLDPTVQALVDATLSTTEPSQDDRARVRSSLLRKAGPGVLALAIPAASAAAGGAAAAAPVGVSAVVKVLAAIALVGATGGGVTYAVRSHAPHASPAVVSIAAQPAVPVDTPPAALELATSEPSVEAKPARASSVARTGASNARSTAGTLKDELDLISGANAALASHDPATALSLAEAHASRFPQGQLAEEREALRVLSICSLGRGDARASAERFLRSRPRSTFAPRIREACGLK